MNASPKYTIDVLDRPAAVGGTSPSRAATRQANPVEEVFAEVKADDDFGVKQVQMFYSVNGGAEKTIKLFGGAQDAARGHRQPHDLPRGARPEAGRLRLLLRQGDATTTACRARRRRPATSTSCRSGRSARTTSRRSRWPAAAVAAAAATRSASSRSSSARLSRRRSTSFATRRR